MSIRDWFRRKPQPAPKPLIFGGADSPERQIVEALRRSGILPPGVEPQVIVHRGRPEDMAGWFDARQADQVPSPAQTWASWQGAMAEFGNEAPGWTPAMFAVRMWAEDGTDRATFLFGVVRGQFGIFTRPQPVCWHLDEIDDTDDLPATVILASLTHIGSGIGLGTFADRPTAVAAADALLSSNVGIPWGTLTGPASDPEWRSVQAKADAAWTFNGFCIEEHRHCHAVTGAPAEGIWTKTAAAMLEGKPEKLS